MNPGYMSLLLIVVTLILLASGWKDTIIRGIAHRSLLLFFMLWFTLAPCRLPTGEARMYGSIPILAGMALFVLYRTERRLYQLHIVSVSMLLASVAFFLLETVHIAPAIMVMNAEWTVALYLGLMSAVLLKSPAAQLAALSLGLVGGEWLHWYAHRAQVPHDIGGPGFQDMWWMTVAVSRGLSLALQSVGAAMRKAAGFALGRIRRSKQGGGEPDKTA
ncbi:YphA family membrane protein [Paenibacillus ginsengihumi]|uniref:YphA family membrane protein n=1 Tax=Paenibacillus ginsengihumi TaxID=431596 RepID=UPI000361578B|nr:hypothetical protein [Paenibacillus ginsengihumi]